MYILCLAIPACPTGLKVIATPWQKYITQMRSTSEMGMFRQFTRHVVLCGSCGRGMQIEIPTPLLLLEVS